MKILNTSQIKEADAYTIKHEPIASIDLMERASLAFFSWFRKKFTKDRQVIVLCGMGNNGGDGLAIARLLIKDGYSATAYIVKTKDTGSNDFEENLRRLSVFSEAQEIQDVKDFPAIPPGSIIIDALFGSGLSRPLSDIFEAVVVHLNNSSATKIAVDIASGLFADEHSPEGAIFQADYTITFQAPKLAFMLPENAKYTGHLEIVDIGLDGDFLKDALTPYHYLTESEISTVLKPRNKFAHKGDFGKVLLVSGSMGKMGAAHLCAKAALRTGTGLLSLHIPKCGYEIIQATVPEAMVETDRKKKKVSEVQSVEKYDALGIGPGLGTAEETKTMLADILINFKKPLVLDADALNIMGLHKELLPLIPENSILTPHPIEFGRIAGKFNNDFERLSLQKYFSKKYNCIVVLKGAHTSISTSSGDVYFNSTGNPGMASGGSGDVLTGMLTSLLGQQYKPLEAALLGVYLHGLAGDIAAEEFGQEAMLPSDLINNIYKAYASLRIRIG